MNTNQYDEDLQFLDQFEKQCSTTMDRLNNSPLNNNASTSADESDALLNLESIPLLMQHKETNNANTMNPGNINNNGENDNQIQREVFEKKSNHEGKRRRSSGGNTSMFGSKNNNNEEIVVIEEIVDEESKEQQQLQTINIEEQQHQQPHQSQSLHQNFYNDRYQLFCSYKYHDILSKYPELINNNEKLATMIASEWNSLSLDQKLNFDLVSYKKRQEEQLALQRQLQQQANQSCDTTQNKVIGGVTSSILGTQIQQQSQQFQNQYKVMYADSQKKRRRTKMELQHAMLKPKRYMTPYLYFVKENRARIGVENMGRSFQEIMQIISAEWASLTDTQKIRYQELSILDKQRHEQEMMVYNENINKGLHPHIKIRRSTGYKKTTPAPSTARNQDLKQIYTILEQQNQLIKLLVTQQQSQQAADILRAQYNTLAVNLQRMQPQVVTPPSQIIVKQDDDVQIIDPYTFKSKTENAVNNPSN